MTDKHPTAVKFPQSYYIDTEYFTPHEANEIAKRLRASGAMVTGYSLHTLCIKDYQGALHLDAVIAIVHEVIKGLPSYSAQLVRAEPLADGDSEPNSCFKTYPNKETKEEPIVDAISEPENRRVYFIKLGDDNGITPEQMSAFIDLFEGQSIARLELSSLPAYETVAETSALKEKIRHVLNCHSAENGSNTSDFILADYLLACLAAFDTAVNVREQWYGRPHNTPEFGTGIPSGTAT